MGAYISYVRLHRFLLLPEATNVVKGKNVPVKENTNSSNGKDLEPSECTKPVAENNNNKPAIFVQNLSGGWEQPENMIETLIKFQKKDISSPTVIITDENKKPHQGTGTCTDTD